MTVKKTTAVKKPISDPKDGSITVNFEISAATIEAAYQAVVKEYVAKAEIKGFRKGKAPANLVEKTLKENEVLNHVLEHVIPYAYGQALNAKKYMPIIEPKITPISMAPLKSGKTDGKPWQFKAETAGRPELTIGDYKKYLSVALKAGKEKVEKAKSDVPKDPNWRLNIVLDTLLKNTKINVAPMLVDEETKSALSKLVNQLSSLNLALPDYLKSIKKTEDELLKEYRATAETNLKLEFIISELVKELDPETTSDEIAQLKMGEGQKAYAKYLVQKRKTLDLLCEL